MWNWNDEQTENIANLKKKLQKKKKKKANGEQVKPCESERKKNKMGSKQEYKSLQSKAKYPHNSTHSLI